VARAEFNLESQQSSNWYGGNLGGLGLVGLASALALTDADWVAAARIRSAPRFERGTERNYAPLTAGVSDVTLLSSWALPGATLFASREGRSYENSLIIYGQAMGVSLLANTITKKWVLRARPYTHNEDVDQDHEGDENYSFYSGHSALSFTAAVSGSTLFAAVEEDVNLSATHWGATLGLASFTAHARIRAGRHYPTDVLVGSLAGVAVGLGVPLLHGLPLRPQKEEILGASGGVLVGLLAAYALPRDQIERAAPLVPAMIPTQNGIVFAWQGRFQ
jgi:membrane-associated phospholipid phosphatase